MFGLEYLIYPHSVDDFKHKYLGKRAVLMQNDKARFEQLFGWKEVNHHLNQSRKSNDGIRLAYETKPLGPVELSRVDHWLKEGATLIINNINCIDEYAKTFGDLLASDLNSPININCYASCPSKQGFDNHFDQHDVFIIQTEGSKRWVVFEPTKTFPLHIQMQDKGEPPTSEAYIECEMTAGDVLYIPRGHWHYAVATTPSVHLTVGTSSRSGTEFLNWLSAQLMDNEEFFRKDFPTVDTKMFNGELSDDELTVHLNEFRDRLKEMLDRDSLKEAFVRYIMSANPLKKQSALPHVWTLGEEVTEQTQFVAPIGQKALVRFDDETEDAVIHIRGNQLNLQKMPKVLIKTIFESNHKPFTGEQLIKACAKEEIDWEKIKPLLLTMHGFGLLVINSDIDEK